MAAPLTVAGALAVPALFVAREATLQYASLKWDSGVLQQDELPPELMAKPNLVLIYLLPRMFRKLGFPQAAQFNEIWQHGTAGFKGLKLDAKLEGSPYYWMFSWAQFAKISPALRTIVADVMKDNVDALPRLGTPQGEPEVRWKDLRDFARGLRRKYRGKNAWKESSPDYRWTLTYPRIPLETRPMTTAIYWLNGENPVKSDAYAAIGPCAVRSYLFADFRKQDGDDNIYVRPRRVGVRVWDDYNFNDSSMFDYISGLIADGEASQFLGKWKNRADGSTVTLHNSDFEEYRTWFAPLYNQHLEKKRASPEKMLKCTDFHAVSTWVEEEIKTPDEYPVSPLWLG